MRTLIGYRAICGRGVRLRAHATRQERASKRSLGQGLAEAERVRVGSVSTPGFRGLVARTRVEGDGFWLAGSRLQAKSGSSRGSRTLLQMFEDAPCHSPSSVPGRNVHALDLKQSRLNSLKGPTASSLLFEERQVVLGVGENW